MIQYTIILALVTLISGVLAIFFSKANRLGSEAVNFIALFLHCLPAVGVFIVIRFTLFGLGIIPTPLHGFPNERLFPNDPIGFALSYLHFVSVPVISMVLVMIGGTFRELKATMLDELGKPYIYALRARGISEWRIQMLHAFKNCSVVFILKIPALIITLFGYSILLEVIFRFPGGLGSLVFQAVEWRNAHLVLSSTMVIGAVTGLTMIICDIIVAIIDPRIKYGRVKD